MGKAILETWSRAKGIRMLTARLHGDGYNGGVSKGRCRRLVRVVQARDCCLSSNRGAYLDMGHGTLTRDPIEARSSTMTAARP